MQTSHKLTALPRGGEPVLGEGRVVAREVDASLAVEIEGVTRRARQAFSCLVQPEPGDRVLLSIGTGETPFVLAVLERPGKQDLAIEFPGGAAMRARQGPLRLEGGASLSIATEGRLSCLSDSVVHRSREAVLSFDETLASGTSLQARFESLRLFGRFLTTLAHHVTQRFGSYNRRTEASDQVESGQMMRKSKGLLSHSSSHTVMVSREDTRIDGKRIHLG